MMTSFNLMYLISMLILPRIVAVPIDFTWVAGLNRDTGIAASCEMSSARYSTSVAVTQTEMANLAESIIVRYPRFLATPSLTLGLLKAKNRLLQKQYCLCTSIWDMNLLTFGPPKVTSQKICRQLGRKHNGSIIYSLEIPVIGGLLSRSSGSIRRTEGCIRFTLISKSRNAPNKMISTILVTEIAGPYRPSIAGNEKPRSLMRSALYYGTQRIFHEYVMWRFHIFFRRELRRALLKVEKLSFDNK